MYKLGDYNPQKFSRLYVVKDFMPSITYWARYYARCGQNILSFEDLITVGIIGLIDAINKYDPFKKNKFKTYAEFRIRGEIIDELRRHDWVSRSDRQKQKQLRNEEKSLIKNLGREPTHHELNNVLEFKPNEYSRVKSIDENDKIYTYQESDITTLSSASEDNVFQMVADKQSFSQYISLLNENARYIIIEKYYKDKNFSEIAQDLNLSEGRISQIHSETLEELKGYIRSEEKLAS